LASCPDPATAEACELFAEKMREIAEERAQLLTTLTTIHGR
jgi:hypothetical protein